MTRVADPSGHRCLSLRTPCPGVGAVFVPHSPVDLENALPMIKDMTGDSARERILGIGVEVHHHYAERDRVVEVLLT
jgi:hypothetical protein